MLHSSSSNLEGMEGWGGGREGGMEGREETNRRGEGLHRGRKRRRGRGEGGREGVRTYRATRASTCSGQEDKACSYSLQQKRGKGNENINIRK